MQSQIIDVESHCVDRIIADLRENEITKGEKC
jgi:hypothetical protein